MGGGTVSVIVPVYKIKPEYLRKSVESILTQTYTDLEVILVDDGSPDSCGAICDEYAAADARVSVVHQENGGVSVARNAGLERASGGLVSFVDPDDYLDADCIEQLLAALPQDAQIVSCCCKVIGEDFVDEDHFFAGDRVFCEEPAAENDPACSNKDDLFFQLMQCSYGQPGTTYTAIGVPWGKLYRTAFLREHGLAFDPGLRRMQDNLFNMLAYHAATRIVYVDRPLYNYRHEHIAAFGKDVGPEWVATFTAVAKARVRVLQQTGLAQDERMRAFCDREVAGLLFNMLHRGVFGQRDMSLTEKRERAEAIVAEPPFCDVVQQHLQVGVKRGLCLTLARHHAWGAYAALVDAWGVVKRVRGGFSGNGIEKQG